MCVEPHPYPDIRRPHLRPWLAVGWASGIAAILVIHILGRAGAYCSPMRTDSYVFSSFGYRIAHGDVMYRDMNDAKPPGMFLLNAAAYLAAPPVRQAMIPVESIGMLLGYWALYRTAGALYGRGVGLIVAVTAAMAINFFLLTDYTIEGFNLAENYMVLTSAAAAWSYIHACRCRRIAVFFGCGLWLGLGFVLKQTVLPLLVAVAFHHAALTLAVRQNGREWLTTSAALLAGAVAALLPFALLLAAQGTLGRAAASTFVQAASHLTRETAWPARWKDVLPLWVPMGWCGLGLLGWVGSAWARGRASSQSVRTDRAPSPGASEVLFLLTWLACECVMLVYLPRRAFHYYVLAHLPLVLLSGLWWSALLRAVRELPGHSARIALAAAGIGSLACVRPAIDAFVPTVLARVHGYDAQADRAFFETALKWGNLDIG